MIIMGLMKFMDKVILNEVMRQVINMPYNVSHKNILKKERHIRRVMIGIKLEEMYLISVHFLFVFVKIYGYRCRGGACSSRNRIAAR